MISNNKDSRHTGIYFDEYFNNSEGKQLKKSIKRRLAHGGKGKKKG
jgi:hypothetical protein